MGAEGVVIPHVRTKDDIAQVVKAAKFPLWVGEAPNPTYVPQASAVRASMA